jgi:glycosyltransferase involved in cell wall biosynthesis
MEAGHVVKISVIVPVHNTAAHLRRRIAALEGQDHPREAFEVLMVDNNSTDGSADILSRAGGIRVLTEAKQGSYAARNRAVGEARGTVLAFTDSDCAPDAGWLRAIDTSLAQPGVQVVLGCRRPAGDSGLISLLADYENKKDEHVFASPVVDLYYGFTNNMGVRRSTFLTRPFGPMRGTSRGACLELATTLQNAGITIWSASAARVAHPPPRGWRHFVLRALTQGRDRLARERGWRAALSGVSVVRRIRV